MGGLELDSSRIANDAIAVRGDRASKRPFLYSDLNVLYDACGRGADICEDAQFRGLSHAERTVVPAARQTCLGSCSRGCCCCRGACSGCVARRGRSFFGFWFAAARRQRQPRGCELRLAGRLLGRRFDVRHGDEQRRRRNPALGRVELGRSLISRCRRWTRQRELYLINRLLGGREHRRWANDRTAARGSLERRKLDKGADPFRVRSSAPRGRLQLGWQLLGGRLLRPQQQDVGAALDRVEMDPRCDAKPGQV
jgi:hypothetical protein